MKRKRLFLLMFMLFCIHFLVSPLRAEVIFQNDFEAGWGMWWADMGIWEVGTPTAGPASCHGGDQCAGTVLDGNYPYHTDSRFISPSIKFTPLGYSCSGIILETNIENYKEDERVACAGSNHAEIIYSPKNFTCKIPDN